METTPSSEASDRPARTVRAILLGDRIDTAGLERTDMLSAAPLAFRHGPDGFVTLFRYGIAVLVGLSPIEEDEFLRALQPRIHNRYPQIEDESTLIEVVPEKEDTISPGGRIALRNLAPERLLVVADALAKSMALAREEREVARVLDRIEPMALVLAEHGRTRGRRHEFLKLIGQALHVQQRMSGRVAVEEKPDLLWDRPDLERLYARLEDEYELKERAAGMTRKLEVIRETAQVLADLVDTGRSLRLEIAIVVLIVLEVLITVYQLLTAGGH